MSAFGPYKDLVEIDFEKIGTDGIFLITGDTGSGKTTIFDAISFALFGEASGSRRENSSFRSDFANDDISTFVRLEFIHKDILYSVERFPRYRRKKKRGEGMTLVGGEASLTYMDQVITGDANVTDKCVEILGMNANQFKQIVMIAQGEFLELLLAKPKDRADIFRHIFNTDIFKSIGDNLKSRYLEKKREYEDNFLTIKGYIQGVLLDDGLLGEENTEQVLELLEKELIKDVALEVQLEKEKGLLLAESNKLIKEISEAKLINDSIISLKNFQDKLDMLLSNEKKMLEQEQIVKENIDIWNFIMPIYSEKKRLEKEIGEKNRQLEINKEKFDIIMKDYDSYLRKYQTIDDKLEIIHNYALMVDELKKKIVLMGEIDELKKKIEELSVLFCYIELLEKKENLNKFKRYQEKVLEINKLKEQLKTKKDNYMIENEKYLYNYDLFLSAQAGILASNLNEGNPCPVCGSMEHPCKAKLIDNIYSREELENEKNSLEKVYYQLENLRVDIFTKEKELEVIKGDIELISEDDLKQEISVLEEKCSNLEEANIKFSRQDLEIEIRSLKAKVDDKVSMLNLNESSEYLVEQMKEKERFIKEMKDEIKKIKEVYDEIVKNKVQLESLIKVLDLDIVSLKEELVLKDKEYVCVYQNLGYEDEKYYLDIFIEKEVLENLDKEVRNYFEQLLVIRGKIVELEKIIGNRNKINVDDLEEQLNIINKKLNEFDLSLKEVNNKISNNKKVYNNIKIVSEKLTKIEKKVMIYKDLSDTANGTISGKNKLEFEQYVQARYFDQVIDLANKRFCYMTEDRYQLLRKEEAVKLSDKLGLELEVMDYYTGKKRDIRSLSGGESFKAALALALGMSDTIQHYAGGIVVEAMFIDEGFGSLDDDSLEQAMNAIMMLSQGNKLIGIISHVNELKTRIDKKIVVKKSSCGSNIELVI